MLVLWLPMLAAFVIALIYVTLLGVHEIVRWAQKERAGDPKAAPQSTALMAGIRRATQEITAILGLGDD